MPQEIRVLCCYKCKMFQADIVKKTNKWQCKLCQEKQSVFKEFFRGSGAECRQHVQELNLNKQIKSTEIENELLSLLDSDDLDIDLEAIIKENDMKDNQQRGQGKIDWGQLDSGFQERSKKPLEMVKPNNKLKRKSMESPRPSGWAKNPKPNWDNYL